MAGADGKILGVLSLIFWALILVVTLKYVIFLLRADNHGRRRHAGADGAGAARRAKRPGFVILLGIIAAALFYGDAVHHAGALRALGRRGP